MTDTSTTEIAAQEQEEFDKIVEQLNSARSVSSRTMLWNRTGVIFDEKPATAAEAMAAANLNWAVDKRPLGFHNAKGNFVRAPGQFATVRTDTDDILGTVKSRYQVFQNSEAFGFANALVDDGSALFESAWEQGGGKVVGLTMRLPETVIVGAGDDDPFSQYLILKTAHDGSSAIKVSIATTRMTCMNQFDSVIKGAPHRWSVTHSAKAGIQLTQAREALELTFAYNEVFQKDLEQMMNTTINLDVEKTRMDTILKKQRVGDRARPKTVNSIFANLEVSSTIPDDHRRTAYGLFNATTEYFEHLRPYKTENARLGTNTEGLGARTRNALHAALVAV